MRDVERRGHFLWAVHKRFPKFHVKCCHYAHCYSCMLDDWHDGFTCHETQQEQGMCIEAQFCPECGVPTIRTNGCSDMLCPCGSSWEWEGDDDDDDRY